MATKTPSLIGAAEACRLIGVDRSTLLRWARDGRIHPAMRVGEGRTAAFLFRRGDVERLAKHAA